MSICTVHAHTQRFATQVDKGDCRCSPATRQRRVGFAGVCCSRNWRWRLGRWAQSVNRMSCATRLYDVLLYGDLTGWRHYVMPVMAFRRMAALEGGAQGRASDGMAGYWGKY
jgi:hypothetical protein